MVVLKVDIAKWGSPITTQFNIQSIPYLEVYDTKGELLHKGTEARQYVDRLEAKLRKKRPQN